MAAGSPRETQGQMTPSCWKPPWSACRACRGRLSTRRLWRPLWLSCAPCSTSWPRHTTTGQGGMRLRCFHALPVARQLHLNVCGCVPDCLAFLSSPLLTIINDAVAPAALCHSMHISQQSQDVLQGGHPDHPFGPGAPGSRRAERAGSLEADPPAEDTAAVSPIRYVHRTDVLPVLG